MAKKVYAIQYGFDIKNNKKVENVIVNTWNECLAYVKGVKGAKYKSFEDIEEAKSYLNEGNRMLKRVMKVIQKTVFMHMLMEVIILLTEDILMG
ncbi:viroplasmin and RNaseH domain-containing protein [Clostridium beijerinckii]|nr:viroplasmin and RNaseH domain-containing protein [Clostridium beijerinckii]